MSMDNAALKSQVDTFFQSAEPVPQTDSLMLRLVAASDTSAAMRHLNENIDSAMSSAHEAMLEPDYDKFGAAVAADPRIGKFLPSLAIETILTDTSKITGLPYANLISKDDLTRAANDPVHFDAIHRAALAYARDDFDKLRDLNQHDGLATFVFWGDDNSSSITPRDLAAGVKELDTYASMPQQALALQTILNHFGEINTGDTDQITYRMGQHWLQKNPQYAGLLDELPKETRERDLPGSEYLSRDDFKSRLNTAISRAQAIAKLWGLPDNTPSDLKAE